MAWEVWGSQKSWPLPKEESSSSANGSGVANGRSARELKRMLSSSVSFKDLSLPQVDLNLSEDDTSDASDQENSADYLAELTLNAVAKPDKKKLVIVLVGLPGRGKTFLCNKLKCYLNWYERMLAACTFAEAGWVSFTGCIYWTRSAGPATPIHCHGLEGSSHHIAIDKH
jgi:hypothetical protein